MRQALHCFFNAMLDDPITCLLVFCVVVEWFTVYSSESFKHIDTMRLSHARQHGVAVALDRRCREPGLGLRGGVLVEGPQVGQAALQHIPEGMCIFFRTPYFPSHASVP